MSDQQHLESYEIAIVVCHSMRRLLNNYKHYERPASLEIVFARITKMLRSREKTNFKRFVHCTQLEEKIWTNVIKDFDPKTPLLVVDAVCSIHARYATHLSKHANLSDKIMERLSIIQNTIDATAEIEKTDTLITTIYVKEFAAYSGVLPLENRLKDRFKKIKNKTNDIGDHHVQ